EQVVLGLAVVLGKSPLGVDPLLPLEAVERLIECRAFDGQHAVAARVEPARDGVAVHRLPREGAEDEDVDGALQHLWRCTLHLSSSHQVSGRIIRRCLACQAWAGWGKENRGQSAVSPEKQGSECTFVAD